MEFPSEYFKETWFVTSSCFVISIYGFVANKHTSLAENGENFTSAQPRISTHSQGPKI